MAIEYKIGGQVDLAAAALVSVYTVPEAKRALVSAITFANRSAAARSVRLSFAKNGEADALKQYVYYDVNIPAKDALAWTAPLTIAAGDVVRAYSSAVDVNVQVFVQEEDVSA